MVPALVVVLVLLLTTETAWGQDHQPVVKIVQDPGTFPAALGYAFLGAATTVGGVLGGTITKLYFSLGKKDESIAAEKDARRVEAERLLREQQTILREVMAAMTANTAGYQQLTQAVAELTVAVNKLLHLVQEK